MYEEFSSGSGCGTDCNSRQPNSDSIGIGYGLVGKLQDVAVYSCGSDGQTCNWSEHTGGTMSVA